MEISTLYMMDQGADALIAHAGIPIRVFQIVHLKVKRVKAKGRKVKEKVQRHAIFVTSKVTSAQTVGSTQDQNALGKGTAISQIKEPILNQVNRNQHEVGPRQDLLIDLYATISKLANVKMAQTAHTGTLGHVSNGSKMHVC